MQYLIKTTLYCVTITIQTSCFAGVVSIDSGFRLIHQFVSCLRVTAQWNSRPEARKAEISVIGCAAVLLNIEIKGSMLFFACMYWFFCLHFSLSWTNMHMFNLLSLQELFCFIFTGWEASLSPDSCHLINQSNQWILFGWMWSLS